MSDTKRERIITALLLRASTITTANGYNVNMGANVFRAIPKIDPARLPACVVYPLIETVDRIGSGKCLCTMPIRVDCLVLVGSTNPSILAEKMLGDIRKAFMGTPVASLLIEEMAYTSGGTSDYSKEDSVLVVANFTVKYFTAIKDPYT